MRPVIVSVLSAVAICLALAGNAQASPAGMQIFVNTGSTTTNTGNINTATSFTFGLLVSTSVNSGVFASMPTQTFSSVSFTTSVPTSLTFSSAAFGTFTSTSITESSNVAGSVSFDVIGNWTAGTFGGVTGTFPALLTISLTQTPAGMGAISMSASFATPPPGVVPEPSSVVLILSGLALGVVVWCFRRGWVQFGRRQVAVA